MCEENPPGTNKAYALSVYILLILGCIMPITLPIGIILAYTMRHEAKGTTGGAHLDYLITTFWISMGGVLAGLASPVFIPLGGPSVFAAWRAQCFRRLAGPVFSPLGGPSVYPA